MNRNAHVQPWWTFECNTVIFFSLLTSACSLKDYRPKTKTQYLYHYTEHDVESKMSWLWPDGNICEKINPTLGLTQSAVLQLHCRPSWCFVMHLSSIVLPSWLIQQHNSGGRHQINSLGQAENNGLAAPSLVQIDNDTLQEVKREWLWWLHSLGFLKTRRSNMNEWALAWQPLLIYCMV